ncbi:MAG: DUF3750 domain-containing protein [Deltaproteobacteria bacterium]|nr:DUF3750 domain-containing protein [Deltaproteobacteria bacterium]
MLSRVLIGFLLALGVIPAVMILSGAVSLGRDYRTADRSSAGIAPDPEKTLEAVVQVYAARALNWRGLFGVHTWIATKAEKAPHFTVHQMIGWRVLRNLPGVVSEPGIPDRNWFGNRPEIIAELRGKEATEAIAKIAEAVESYPYVHDYRLWPGPNSNTFTAFIARQVPELKLDLPVTAIGKDYPVNGAFLARVPSGTGYQISLYGILGILAAREEGLELNLFGLSFGIDFTRPALKLPFIGRLGFG